MRPEHLQQLELVLDRYTLSEILEGLQEICFRKAEFVQDVWRDRKTAKNWMKAGRDIMRGDTDNVRSL